MQLTLVCAVTDEDTLRDNLLKSRAIKEKQCELKLFKQHKDEEVFNIASAYNTGKMQSQTTHVGFIDQHIFLPDTWYTDMMLSLTRITQIDSDFGALGVAGVSGGKISGYVRSCGRVWGSSIGLPKAASTLNEMLIITRKDNVFFDDNSPSAFILGADLCLQYRMRDLRNYIINAYCHISRSVTTELPDDFEEAKDYLRKKYLLVKPEYQVFPIRTTGYEISKQAEIKAPIPIGKKGEKDK